MIKKFIFILFIITQNAFSFESGDIVVKAKSQKDIQQVRELIFSKKIAVKVSGEKFLLIPRDKRIDDESWEKLQEQIKLISSQIMIRPEKKMVPLIDFNQEVSSCEIPKPKIDIDSNITTILGKLNEEDCSLSLKCKGQSLSWAPLVIGADFAEKIVNEEISKNGKENLLSHVAVIDTGFDVKDQKSGLMVPVNMHKGSEDSGDLNSDEGGHGSPVAGMIAGKETGITKNINLSVYKITREFNQAVDNSVIAAAVEKACKDNNDIVNLSWGSLKDEQEELNAKEQLWYEVAERLGCLVIKAAGNSGIREKKGGIKTELSDPLLVVEALNSFNERASFSTTGMIAAPGAGVYSLLSNEHLYGEKVDNKSCEINGNKYGEINGTSFSSPAVAGIAGQIVTVLKARNLIPSDPKLKIKLIKSILIASQNLPEERNEINAYGALLIAQNINKTQQNSSIEDLIEIGKKSAAPICNKKVICKEDSDCQNQKKCINDLRQRSFVCTMTKKETESLISKLNQIGEQKLVMSWMGRLPTDELQKNPAYQKIYSTAFIESIFEEQGLEGKIYLLTTPTFQKRPEWESWVQSSFAENQSSATVDLLKNPKVQELPDWKTWVEKAVSNSPKGQYTGILLKDSAIQKLSQWENWVDNYLDQKSYSSQKDDFLSHEVIQKSPRWVKWATDFLQSSENIESKMSFLTSPNVLKNPKWGELAHIFWKNELVTDRDRIDFLKNSNIQKMNEWNLFAKEILTTSSVGTIGLPGLLMDEKIQQLPEWKIAITKFITTSENPAAKAILLNNQKTLQMPQYNEWLNKFIDNHKSDDSGMRSLLTQSEIKLNPNWKSWVKDFFTRSDNTMERFHLLSDPQVQALPEVYTWIVTEFKVAEPSYEHSKLLQNESFQSNPLWKKYAEEYMKRGDPFYLSSLLLNDKVMKLATWKDGTNRFIDESTESFDIYRFLTNQKVLAQPDWNIFAKKFLSNPKKNEYGYQLLTFPEVLRNKNWIDLAKTYIENNVGKDITSFLKNDYVLNRPEWPSLAKEFLETTNETTKEAFTSDPVVRKRLQLD